MKFAVSGAGGFIGSALTQYLKSNGHEVVPILWKHPSVPEETDVVVHLAGLAHRTGKHRPAEADFEEANYNLTRRLAEAAKASGVRRFVFVSSIAVVAGHAGILSPDMEPKPTTAYGRSKAKAEAALLAMPEIGPIILRPPLVYGYGAKGNIASLTRLALSALPLPFRSVHNCRTLVSLSNLVSAIEYVATHPGLEKSIVHVTDSRPVSLAEILLAIREGAGMTPRLFSVPSFLLSTPMRLVGLKTKADQLFGDLIVDGSALNRAGWLPPQDPKAGLKLHGLKSRCMPR